MNLEQIKSAVEAGETVHLSNESYTVIKDSKNQWLISCANGSAIGLTWEDETTLNGQEHKFYIAQSAQLTHTLEIDELPAELNDLMSCIPFWNKEGARCYSMNCEEKQGRKIQTYEDWILSMMLADCKSMILGRTNPLPYSFDKSGSHVWVHNADNERILMFHFPAPIED